MPKLSFIAALCFPLFCNATAVSHEVATYQELCAKAHDPLKRHQSCEIINQINQHGSRLEQLRQQIAVA